MGWRFRRSLRIVPGIRLNMGKAGFTSISLGGRGATLNLGKRGTTTTVSLPGTGVSYRHQHKNLPLVRPPILPARPAPGRTIAIRTGLFAVLLIGVAPFSDPDRAIKVSGPRSGQRTHPVSRG